MFRLWHWVPPFIALGAASTLAASTVTAQMCTGDGNGDNEVTINELVAAVGTALEGCGSSGMVTLSGVAPVGESYRIWATGDRGAEFQTDSDPETGRFTLPVEPDDWYVLGFGHFHDRAEMHFAGHMVFPCDGGRDDHFYLSGREEGLDLGMMTVNDDGSFAFPAHNPLDRLDHDGDGIHDIEDPDFLCEDVVDRNGDGFYDDDMNHDGFHDDDRDRDGHHDGSGHHMNGGRLGRS